LRGDAGSAADLVSCLAGTAAKDSPDDLAKLRRYLEQHTSWRAGPQWRELRDARRELPGG
jgi:hypothetical protein